MNRRKLQGQLWLSVNEFGLEYPWALNETKRSSFTQKNRSKEFHADARRFAPVLTTITASDAYLLNEDVDTSASIIWKSTVFDGTISKEGKMSFENDTSKIIGDLPMAFRP